MKLIIIGNSGSGKTWLATELAKSGAFPVIHMDELFWEPGGFDRKRTRESTLQLVARSKAGLSWIVEGVFGELAELYADQADFFLWLDMEWELCQKRLIGRGSESKRHMGRKQSEEGLRRLLDWAFRYYDRKGSCSYAGHKRLFAGFHGKKIHVRSVEQARSIADCAKDPNPGKTLARYIDNFGDSILNSFP